MVVNYELFSLFALLFLMMMKRKDRKKDRNCGQSIQSICSSFKWVLLVDGGFIPRINPGARRLGWTQVKKKKIGI